jgi:hypothetical protein
MDWKKETGNGLLDIEKLTHLKYLKFRNIEI